VASIQRGQGIQAAVARIGFDKYITLPTMTENHMIKMPSANQKCGYLDLRPTLAVTVSANPRFHGQRGDFGTDPIGRPF